MKFIKTFLTFALVFSASFAGAQSIYPQYANGSPILPCITGFCPGEVPADGSALVTRADLRSGLVNIFSTLAAEDRDVTKTLRSAMAANAISAQKGIAVSNAMQQQTPNLNAGETAVTAGLGGSGGETALGMGIHHMTQNNVLLSGSVGAAGYSSVGWHLGSSFKF